MNNLLLMFRSKLLIGLIGILPVLCVTGCGEVPSIAYVNTNELYENFELQKKRSSEFEKWRKLKQVKVDSLESVVNGFLYGNSEQGSMNISENQVVMLAAQYKQEQTSLSQESQEILVRYNEEIWSQLNQFTQDYAKDNGYDLVLGANGMGSIMHAQSYLNITDQVTKFCNDRYKGNK
ncbi:MAG: OmpH family outer membrane protein [Cyclobacteriaceae bacterium]